MSNDELVSMIKDSITCQTANLELTSALGDRTQFPGMALPDNLSFLNLEKYMPGRNRFRGELTTQSLEHFCVYLADHKNQEKPAVYIDDEAMNAKAFFNLGSIDAPGHGDDSAILKLKKTAAYQSILSTNGNTMTQRNLAEWLEDWEENLTALNSDKEEFSLSTAISQIRNIEIKTDEKTGSSIGHFSDQKSAQSNISVGTKDGQSLPSGFRFTCAPWSGLPDCTFILRLAAIGDKGLNLKVVKLEAMQEKIVDDFKAVLTKKLGATAVVTVGSFNTKGD